MVGDEDADKDESVDSADDVDARQSQTLFNQNRKGKGTAQTQSEK